MSMSTSIPRKARAAAFVLSRQRAENLKVWEDLEKAFNEGQGVEGQIVGKVKGGFKVDVGVPAFLPGSHVDIRPNRNLDRFIGTTDRFAILKFNRARGNVVVSRRALLEKERGELKQEILKVLEEGVILEGTVKNITGYGAFVDLGGIDGILHISDMSWGRINHPSEIVQVGEKVKVVVLKFDAEKERISLGMKQLTPDPWHTVAEKYPHRHAGARQSDQHHGLRRVRRAGKRHRRIDPYLRDVVDAQSHPSVQASCRSASRSRSWSSTSIPGTGGSRSASNKSWPIRGKRRKEKYPVGTVVSGPVRNITDFGIFVGIEEGIDGLVHISDLHWTKKVKHPSELYKKGDIVEAKVLGVSTSKTSDSRSASSRWLRIPGKSWPTAIRWARRSKGR